MLACLFKNCGRFRGWFDSKPIATILVINCYQEYTVILLKLSFLWGQVVFCCCLFVCLFFGFFFFLQQWILWFQNSERYRSRKAYFFKVTQWSCLLQAFFIKKYIEIMVTLLFVHMLDFVTVVLGFIVALFLCFVFALIFFFFFFLGLCLFVSFSLLACFSFVSLFVCFVHKNMTLAIVKSQVVVLNKTGHGEGRVMMTRVAGFVQQPAINTSWAFPL